MQQYTHIFITGTRLTEWPKSQGETDIAEHLSLNETEAAVYAAACRFILQRVLRSAVKFEVEYDVRKACISSVFGRLILFLD